MAVTDAELDDIQRDAESTARLVGAPGSPVRLRAEATVRLVAEVRRLRERAEAAEANTVAVEHDRDYLVAAIREAIAVRKIKGWFAGERILERALVRCAYCERYDCAWVTCDARLRAAVGGAQ